MIDRRAPRLGRTRPSVAAYPSGDERSDPDAARREAIFAERAEALSRVPSAEASGSAHEALVFHLGEECYAFSSEQVLEVRPLPHLTRLPSAPAFVAGLVNVRGRIVPILDLRPLFGLPSPPGTARSIILLSSARGTVGVLATDRPEVRRLPDLELTRLPAGTPPGLDPIYVRGLTRNRVVVLDAKPLLADQRVIVQDDASQRFEEN
jgi:purine-binding chemotaxis protein CheW